MISMENVKKVLKYSLSELVLVDDNVNVFPVAVCVEAATSKADMEAVSRNDWLKPST